MARVLLVSCYELGHQPLLVAGAAGFLGRAGVEVRCRDLALEELPDADVDWATVVAVAVPMHTATRLARRVCERVRARRGAGVTVVLHGLYAPMAARLLPDGLVDAGIGGEAEEELVRLATGGISPSAARPVVLDRLDFPPPARAGLPALERYARLHLGDERLGAGYVEASRGCVHRCRHCPVPVVYDGRIRVVPVDTVVADAAAQWEMGARHLTIGDPDFLNAVPHALRVARALAERLPGLGFDVTTKVEHVLEHPGVWADLRALGLRFVVSAVESTDDEVLRVLDKGHTRADTEAALRLLRGHGIELRPSLLPFTPWSSLGSFLDLLDAVAAWDLVDSVDPVQLSIRLLLPEGSLLLGRPETEPHLTGARDEVGSHLWRHPDPAMDGLAAAVGSRVAADADAGADPRATHAAVRALAAAAAAGAGIAWEELPPPVTAGMAWAPRGGRPRLSEPWFCCAEPTPAQLAG